MYIYIMLFIYIFVTLIEIMIFKKYYTKYNTIIIFILSWLYNFVTAAVFVPISFFLLIIGFRLLGALFGEWIFPIVILLYIALWVILLVPINKFMKKRIKINLFVYIILSIFAIILGIMFFFGIIVH